MSGHTRENLRDGRGWMIPRAGSLSLEVYDLLLDGYRPKEIAKKLNRDVNWVNQVVFRIRSGNEREM